MNNVKIGKEEIQKIFLGILLGIGVVYGYFEWLLNPLKARQAAIAKNITELGPAISKAKAQLARDASVSAQAPVARATIEQIDSMIPEGAPVAWFPPRMAEFFRSRGIERVTSRLTSESAIAGLPAYRRLTWAVDIPKVECLRFGTAVAELENAEPLLWIEGLTIEMLRDEPDALHVYFTMANIVKK
jgi:hypothetical protein